MDTKIVSWLLNDCWGVSFKEGLIEAFSKIWISQSDLKFKNKKKEKQVRVSSTGCKWRLVQSSLESKLSSLFSLLSLNVIYGT